MQSQKTVKAPDKPTSGHKELATTEQAVPQYDSFSAILAAKRANNGSSGDGEATSPPPPRTSGISPQHIARLQRTIGNQATNRLLRKQDATAAAAPAIQQSAPTGAIQRDLFGLKKRKQKREQKKKTEWDTRLTGYSAAKLAGWQTSVYAAVEAEMKKRSIDALKALETDVRAKALSEIQDPLDESIQDIQGDITSSTDKEKNRKDQFRIDRLQYNFNQSTGQVNAALKASFAGHVNSDVQSLILDVTEVQKALDKIEELVKTKLEELITGQDKNTPKSEKDFDKEVKRLMTGQVTTEANTNTWTVINTYLQDPANKDAIVQNFATKIKTPVTDIHTQEGTKKDAWNNKLEAIETRVLSSRPGEDWPGYITTTVTTSVEKQLKENLRSDDRRQKLMAKLKLAIDHQVTIIEDRLNTQMGTATDPIAKERLRLEKEKIKERFGDKAKELVEKNEPEYQRTIDETVAALLAKKAVKKDLDAKEFVTTKVRGLLDPKRENTANFSNDVEKKINKELKALKPAILKEWTTSAEQKISTYVTAHETQITDTFKAKMGIKDTGETYNRVETAGRGVVKDMDTGDQTSKGTVDEAYLKELYKSSVLTPVTEYLSNKFGKEGMSWKDFRSEKAKEFRKRMKDVARQQAYKEIETEKDTHAKTSSMTDTGKNYIGHLAKNKAYKYAKESLNEQMGILAEEEAKLVVPEANVLFELDMAWRDAVTVARDSGKGSGAQTTAGKAAAKTRATALFEEYKVIAKDRKNQLFGKGGTAPQYVQNVAPTPQTQDEIEQDVEGKVTKDRVANRSLTKAIEADSVTQGYNKTASLINFFLPTPGDEVKFDIQMRIPVYSDGIVKAFVMFYLMGKAGREAVDEVKVALSVGVGGGLSFWGGEATFKVGYFIEAQAETASKIGMLMSYGTYRQMSSAGPIDLLPRLAHALWGGAGIKYDEKDQPGGTSKAENTSKNFAEMWAAMVEETAMQRHFLPSKINPDTDTPGKNEDAYREKDGRLAVTKIPVAPGKTEGREYLGKVSHVAEAKKSITVGDFSFTYDETATNPSGSQAVKADPADQISKGTEVYAKDWTGVGTIELTTKESSPGKKHQALGKVKEISPAGKRLLIDTKSGNYVDVGMLIEAAGNVNFGVGKAEGVATYKQLSRFSKKVIDRMTQDKFGKYDPSGQKLKDLGTQNKVLGGAGGERRYIGELEGKAEVDLGAFKASMGIGLKLVFSDLDRFHVTEFEGQGSFGLPSQFLDEAPKEVNEWASKVGGPFLSALKTLIGRGMEARKNMKDLRDDTGDPGKETGVLLDTAFDISVPTVHLIGDGGNTLNQGNPSLYDKLIESGGDTDKNETVNDTVRQWFPGQEEGSSKIGGAVKKFAMKNELTVTAKYGWDHGRSKFTIDIKQTKGGEVDLGIFKAKVEKSKEFIKFGAGQDDRKFKMHTHQPPTDLDKGKKVYFKDGKITRDKNHTELAGILVKVNTDGTATVRSWAAVGNIMGYAL